MDPMVGGKPDMGTTKPDVQRETQRSHSVVLDAFICFGLLVPLNPNPRKRSLSRPISFSRQDGAPGPRRSVSVALVFASGQVARRVPFWISMA